MTKSSGESSDIVVDASFAVLAVLPYSPRDTVLQHFAAWHQADRRILAPALWLSEAVSVIRKQTYFDTLTQAESRTATEDLWALGVTTVPIDLELCHSALRWAERLGQARAYDGFYLALAERHEADFWTMDQRLKQHLQQIESGLSVYQVPSSTSPPPSPPPSGP